MYHDQNLGRLKAQQLRKDLDDEASQRVEEVFLLKTHYNLQQSLLDTVLDFNSVETDEQPSKEKDVQCFHQMV